MMATFQTTGATYDRKKRRWLFSTPRHQAESARSPAPGKRMRTSRTVSSRLSPSKPGAMTSISHGARRTPASTRSDTAKPSSVATAVAVAAASRVRPAARRLAYTGMRDAESTPSPNRFCRKLGIRNAALNASAASDVPK
jgi:hypothetical protein